MRNFLFDTPWWVLTLIGVAGAALLMSGNARQNKALLRAGIGVILLCVVMAAISWLVDTPKEKVIKATHALVKAAVDRDSAALAAGLHPNAALAGWNRQQIIDGAAVLADQFGLKSATITGMQTQEEPTLITVNMRVLATFQSRQIPYDTTTSDWELNWWEMPDGRWLLKDVTPKGTGNLSGGQMSRQFFQDPPG